MIEENNILNYVKAGRNSFLDFHRRAQTIILDELDAERIWKQDGSRFEKADLIDLQEFKEWSTNLTLSLIFKDISDKPDDQFAAKMSRYLAQAKLSKQRGAYRLDFDANGTQESAEKLDNFSIPAYRR